MANVAFAAGARAGAGGAVVGVYVSTEETGVAVGCGTDCMAAVESKSIKNTS